MDAVILYVDGSDPLWQKDYRGATREPIEASRFRDWGTLPYLFRGIATCMPFIEKVFLVVSRESQVPGWIDREKVNIVLHKDIIPEQYLPTFNSCVIETHIPYIEGLSEEFLYFNDDMFPINPCEPEMFFKDGRPQDRLTEKCIIYKMGNSYHRRCYNSTQWAKEALGMEADANYFHLAHWPHPLLKSMCLEILEICSEKYAGQVSKVRTMANVNQHLFSDYLFLGGLLDNVELPYKYADGGKKRPKEMAELIETSEAKCICINDTNCQPQYYDSYCRAVLGALKKKFPEKCKYERGFTENTELIISMTSFPARIGCVAGVWKTILNQETDTPFRCVLTLAEEEFPKKELPADLQSLIDTDQIELLWYPRNIRSHKKIIPVLKKYPDATVITVDDDLYRPQGWLKVLLDDHRKYPDDIISFGLAYYPDGDLELRRLRGLHQVAARGKNHIPGLVGNFVRFLSGSGTLFPAHTFTDPRFFDEDLMMSLSPTSDESWLWLFAILADKTIRQTSKIFDESAYNYPGSQRTEGALFLKNKKNYPIILRKCFETFPEFGKKIRERQRKVVVSLTSYPARYAVLPRVLDSLLGQTIKPSAIVLTLFEGDAAVLTPELKRYLERGDVKLLTVEKDLKPHNKYFYTMQEYRDYAVITVDDDVVYPPTLVETLLKGYWSHPDCVIARRVHKIERRDGVILPYEKWTRKCKTITEPSEELFATGVGGVLYPPNILNLSKENLSGIRDVLYADDIYLKALEQEKGIKTLYVPGARNTFLMDSKTQERALSWRNVKGKRNDEYIRKFLK